MIIAHRGESFIAPENSLSAINLAWEKGAEGVEIDVHLTADNEIVVIHDAHTGRTGNMKYIIAGSSLQELKNVDIGRKKDKSFTGERIPTLKEVIKTIPEERKLIIEIKCAGQIVAHLTEILEKSGLRSCQFEIISFDIEILAMAKKTMPQYKMLWLLDLDYYWPYWLLRTNHKNIIKQVITRHLDGVNVWAGKLLDRKFVKAFKEEDLMVYTWTVNDAEKAKELLSVGVDAITTDRAAWLTQELAK